MLATHRRLGRIGVAVLVPALLLGGLKMMHAMVGNAALYPPGAIYQLGYIDAISLILFTLAIGLSLYYRKQLPLHARYMACTVLIILPPAITRLLFFIPWFDSFDKTLNGSFFIMELVLLRLLLDDKRTTARFLKPYQLMLGAFILLHITMNKAGNLLWWRSLLDQFGQLPL
jgi:hypothetical protein